MLRSALALILLCLLCAAPLHAQEKEKKRTADELQIQAAIKSFYAWYRTHQTMMSSFNEVNVRSDVKAATSVNWPEVEKVHAYLRAKAPQLSAAYYVNDMALLREKDSLFRANPDEDMGFDYDRYTHSQEASEVLYSRLAARNRWDTHFSGDTAYVTAYGLTAAGALPDFAFSWEMHKEGGAWKIARICGDIECRQ